MDAKKTGPGLTSEFLCFFLSLSFCIFSSLYLLVRSGPPSLILLDASLWGRAANFWEAGGLRLLGGLWSCLGGTPASSEMVLPAD